MPPAQTAKQVLRRYGEATSASAARAGLRHHRREAGRHHLAPQLPARASVHPAALSRAASTSRASTTTTRTTTRGLRWYRSHFPLEAGGRHLARPGQRPAIAGEASPYYLFHPLAAERLARDFPDVRIIVNLRDPVERAYSHYKEQLFQGRETLSFEAALDAEDERLRGEAERIAAEPGYRSTAHEHLSYLAQSRYLDMLPRWFSLFPRDQFHITASEDFYADPDRHVNDIWRFLGLPPRELVSRTRHNHQQAPGIAPETRQCLLDAFAEHNRRPGGAAGAPAALARKQAAPLVDPTWRRPDSEPPRASGRVGVGAGGPWPSVTAIVPTRDRPALLARAVRSVVGQSYPGELECVIVFDQSRPVPVDVDLPASRRVRLLTNTRTPGAAGARNTGIAASDGALVAFCDDDDTWHADKLRLQVERLGLVPAGFVACGMRIHYADRVVDRPVPGSVELPQIVRKRYPEFVFPTFCSAAGCAGRHRAAGRTDSRQLRRGLRLPPARRAARADRRGRAAARGHLLASAVVLRPALADHRRRAQVPAG